MRLRVGQAGARRAQVLVPDRREQDKADGGLINREGAKRRRRGRRGRGRCFFLFAALPLRGFHCGAALLLRGEFNRIHALAEFLFETRGAHGLGAVAGGVGVQRPVLRAVGHFLQGRGHAVAEEDDGGLYHGDLFLQPLPALRGRVEGCARPAAGRVAAEGEIAHGEPAIGELLDHARLQVAIGAFALEERVAEEEDAVAVLDFKWLRASDVREEECGEGEEDVAHEQSDSRAVFGRQSPGQG